MDINLKHIVAGVGAMAAGVALVSCASGASEALPPEPEAEPSFSDVFNLVVETERWGVMMDAAMTGASAKAVASGGEPRPDIYRVDYALRSGVRYLIALRDGLCIEKIEPETTCTPIDLPAWTTAPPDVEGTPFAEYQARSEWLGAVLQPYVAAGCRAGESATGDEMFCAVE